MKKKKKNKYSKARPSIPAHVKQQIRIESGFACVICNEMSVLEIAHIDGNRENNDPDNLALLCPNHHRWFDKGEIKRKEIIEVKNKAKERNEILSRVKERLEYLEDAEIEVSLGYAEIKIKYQNLLNDYGDKLIFYQCFIYLIPEFYIDERGELIREVIRNFLNITSEEERQLIDHLIRLELIKVTGGLISLRNKNDAKIALSKLLRNNKISIPVLIGKLSQDEKQ